MRTKRDRIIKLRRRGYSYSEICKKLKISRRDVTRFSKKVKFSRNGYKRYIKNVTGIIKEIPNKSKRLTLRKVRVIGNLLFDGAVYKNGYNYSIMYINSSRYLINQFLDDMEFVYNVCPSSFEHNKNYYRVKYNSKLIYSDLMKYLNSFSTADKNCFISSKVIYSKLAKLIILRSLST